MAQHVETAVEHQDPAVAATAQKPSAVSPQERPHEEDHEGEPPPKKKRAIFRGHPLRIAVALVVLAALVVGGMFLWAYMESFESTDDAQVDGHIYPVSARVGGRVTEVKVDNNYQVSLGQVLVQLDPTDYQVALQKAQADLGQSEADALAAQSQVPIITSNTSSQTSTASASVEEASVAISVAQQQSQAALARVREAQANAVKAQADVERYRPLVAKEEISRQQFDQAVATASALAATVDTAKASADAAARQVEQARARLTQTQAQQAATRSAPQQIAAERAKAQSSQAAVGVQRAAVEQAKLSVRYTTVTAPVLGVVGQRSAQVGQQVQPGQELMSVIPLDDLWITANFKETQLKNMHLGQKVEIGVDSTGKKYRGHVDSFPGATGVKFSLLPPENATGNYVKVVQRLPVKIVLEQGEDPQHQLRPGMSAEPKVYIK